MKHLLSIGFALGASSLLAQVVLDKPVHFTGGQNERTVAGVEAPTDGSSLLSVGGWVNGSTLWASATDVGTTIQLTTVPSTPSQEGSFLRFVAPASFTGPLFIQLDGSLPLPLVRPDGLPPVQGQVVIGMVSEILRMGDRFILMNTAVRGCPQNALDVNGRYCIDISQGPQTGFYEAVDRCAIRGGKLCRWDEYFYACSTLGNQLLGLFDDWEWIDDTANHVHLADRAGRTTCMSQETASALTQPSSSRCCYRIP